jgi:hypothetical protein
MSSPESGSLLLAEEYFEREDDRFLDAIRSVAKIEQLAGFAGRWKKDHRPWARQQIFRYLERPLDRQGHQPVVKQLFKQAEEDSDDELMGAFLNAFDRLVRYRRKKQWRYDRQTQQATNEEILVIDRKIDRSVPPVISTRTGVNPFTGRELKFTVRSRPRPPFKYRTRYYLRRRAWRYFRRLGFGRPTEYCRAAARALSRYDDQTLTTGEAILESPGLLHICFGKSDRLEWTPSHVRLKEGAKLDDLKPRPCFPELWNEAAAFDVLLELVASARSRLVRTWTLAILTEAHQERLDNLDVLQIIKLLANDDESVVEFAARQFSRSSRLASLPLDTWFRLLETPNLAAIDWICKAMAEHVRSERLSLTDCVRLACAAPVPIARMGLDWLKSRPIASDEERQLLAPCAQARCLATAGELTRWVLSQVATRQCYLRELASALLDSLNSASRSAAWEWICDPGSPGHEDAVLWSRLTETPHDDIRLPLIDLLHRRSGMPGLAEGALVPVWSAVLSGVHRGGRQKLKAVVQLKDAIRRRPERAAELIPVLAVAARSVREPERASGLSALLELATQSGQLEAAVRQAFPELRF